MNELFGYVNGNAVVADRDLKEFDGCKVRITVMDKKTSETENPKRLSRSFGMARNELRYPNDIDFCNNEVAEMFGVWKDHESTKRVEQFHSMFEALEKEPDFATPIQWKRDELYER